MPTMDNVDVVEYGNSIFFPPSKLPFLTLSCHSMYSELCLIYLLAIHSNTDLANKRYEELLYYGLILQVPHVKRKMVNPEYCVLSLMQAKHKTSHKVNLWTVHSPSPLPIPSSIFPSSNTQESELYKILLDNSCCSHSSVFPAQKWLLHLEEQLAAFDLLSE